MRAFAVILSTYIAALSLVPCADSVQHSSESVGIEIASNEHDHNHSDHSDICTPFCTCVCCGSVIALPKAESSISDKITTCTEYSFRYISNYSFDYSEGTWHPPSFG
jgi:hypothetical protein